MKIAETSLRPLEVWRRDASLARARDFAMSLLATLVRAGHGARVSRSGPRGEQPALLVLYEMETCPFSRLVREALSELDLDCIIKPCPRGEVTHRGELAALRGNDTVPFLIDARAGLGISEASAIVTYLYATYGDGRAPPRMLRGGRLSMLSSRVAALLRGRDLKVVPSLYVPPPTIELFGYEGSPNTRLVREELSRLGVSYVNRNIARGSARREAFEQQFHRLQFPLLVDRETDISLFETAAILAYVKARYCAQAQIPQKSNGMEDVVMTWEIVEN